MTNPNNAVGTNAAYDGRTSVNAFNDDLAAFSSGIISGWDCVPDSGMTVSLGGDGNTRDVAVAEDNAGNKTSINNISGSPVNVTLDAAPGANSRIDLVVAYVDNPPTGISTVADNPSACGIINVTGTPSSTPVIPNDSAIRTAITGDGASGTTAYYVVLAQILVANGTTDITSADITAGAFAQIGANQIQNGAITSDKMDSATFTGATDANGWGIYILPNGKRLWFKKQTANWQTQGNAWQSKSQSPPVGIKNADICVGSAVADDNAIRATVGSVNADFRISLYNAHSQVITTNVHWQAIFIET